MFELTNEQRKCFALPLVTDTWEKVEVKPNPYDLHYTYAYVDGLNVKKVIEIYDEPGHEKYVEYGVDETLSPDKTMLLPKTSKGKPKNFTSTNLSSRTPVGMGLSFNRGAVVISNHTSSQSYYKSFYDTVKVDTFADFEAWLDDWCKNTDDHDLEDVNEFAQRKRIHRKFKEGDFFRYKINRRLYGYGRIILDYARLRKEGVDFWDIFMGKPLCVAVYHIVTERTDVTPEELSGKMMLPSQMIMDNIFYYGECEIIGNLPLAEDEKNYTVHYGKSISTRTRGCVHYQCGRTFLTLEAPDEIYGDFRNKGIGWSLDISLPMLTECIKKHSNDPYWAMWYPWRTACDLRNPKHRDIFQRIKKQMGVE